MSRELTFLIFRIMMTSILLAIQWYFYRRTILYARSHWASKNPQQFIRALFILFNLPLPIVMLVRPRLTGFPEWFFTLGVYPFSIWHGALFLLFLVLSILYLVRFPFSLTVWLAKKFDLTKRKLDLLKQRTHFERWDSSRRLFLQRGFTILAGTTFAGTAYGVYSKYDFEIDRIRIALKNLPPQFEGFTITLVADIHSSVFMTKEDMVRYVTVINEIGSDLIVIPGDFVNSMVEEVFPLAEAFSDLRAPYGVFGSLGNHDFFADVDRVAREIEECGITLLRNARVNIAKEGSVIQLLGVDDAGRAERAGTLFDRALAGVASNVPRILLCHRPYFLEQAVERNIDLTLAGHTHGGQIVFTKIGQTVIAPARLASPYVAGLYQKGESQMYVTRGLGTVGIPIRINCPPEITVITLSNAGIPS